MINNNNTYIPISQYPFRKMSCIQDCFYFVIRGILDILLIIYYFLHDCIYKTSIRENLIAIKNTDILYSITNNRKYGFLCGNMIKITKQKNTTFLVDHYASKITMLVSCIGTGGELKEIYHKNDHISEIIYKYKNKSKIICKTSIIDTEGKIIYNKRLGYNENNYGTKNFATIHDFLNEVSNFAFYLKFYYDFGVSDDSDDD